MAGDWILSVDIGTSGVKAIIFDRAGRMVSSARRSYPMLTPAPDWAEQDPDVVLAAVLDVMGEAYRNRPGGRPVAAVSFSSQWYSIMPIGPDGRPKSRYLTWSDRRAASVADRLRSSSTAAELYRATGCPLDAIYPLSKIAWFREQGTTAARYISIKEYVFHHLFGEYAVDWGLAAATGLLDIRKAVWNDTALAAAGISAAQLSPLVPPRTTWTQWTTDALARTGIPQGTPCVFGGGDGALASVGVGALGKGVAAVNVGTSAAARALVTEPFSDPGRRLWTYLVDEGWWVVGGIVSSGAVVSDWFARILGSAAGSESAAELNTLVEAVPAGAEGLLFLPYLSGEQCPVWDPRTTGAFFGLTHGHGRGHFARAVYEGITMSIARIVDALSEAFAPVHEVRVTGGLAGSPAWLRIAADMFGARVHVPETVEGSARGAAVLAWAALGMADDLTAAAALENSTATVEPDTATHELYRAQIRQAETVLQAIKGTRT